MYVQENKFTCSESDRKFSAGRRSLRRSRLFKVNHFCTNRYSVYDFLWVNSANWNPISDRLTDIE